MQIVLLFNKKEKLACVRVPQNYNFKTFHDTHEKM